MKRNDFEDGDFDRSFWRAFALLLALVALGVVLALSFVWGMR